MDRYCVGVSHSRIHCSSAFGHIPLFSHFHFSASGQAVLTGVVPSPRFLPSFFIAHEVQQSHCSSILHRVLLTHALALSASQFVHKKKSLRISTSNMHSGGLELTKLTYTRLEDYLIRHRGDRYTYDQWYSGDVGLMVWSMLTITHCLVAIRTYYVWRMV